MWAKNVFVARYSKRIFSDLCSLLHARSVLMQLNGSITPDYAQKFTLTDSEFTEISINTVREATPKARDVSLQLMVLLGC